MVCLLMVKKLGSFAMVESTQVTIERVSKLQLRGNIVPHIWFQYILNETGKPDLLGILILSEIVYWYRPKVEKDGDTGEFLGYSKRFKGDMLQRSIESFSDQFGVSKRQVSAALKRLSASGFIIKECRTIYVAGTRYGNVLYMAPVPENLKSLEGKALFLLDEEEKGRVKPSTKKGGRGYKKRGKVSQENATGTAKFCSTNTKNTTQNTQKEAAANNSSSLSYEEANAAAISFNHEKKSNEEDLVITDKLTEQQKEIIEQLVSKELWATVADFSPEITIDTFRLEIEKTILDKQNYTKAGNNFKKKINTIRRQILSGEWESSYVVEHHEEEKNKNKSLYHQASLLESEVAALDKIIAQLGSKKDPQYLAAKRSYEIEKREKYSKISAINAQLTREDDGSQQC